MDIVVWTLLLLAIATIALCAAHVTRQHRRESTHIETALHRVAFALLAAGLLPLPALLATDAPAAAWGLWGAAVIAAGLVYAVADTFRDVVGPQPRHRHRIRP